MRTFAETKTHEVTVDVVILTIHDNKLKVLLIKRANEPFRGKWSIPGGFIRLSENIDDAALRVLKEKTTVSNIYLEQLYTFDSLDRDPRMRVVSTSYVALIDKNKLTQKVEHASWFDITLIEEKDNLVEITLDNGEEVIRFSIKKVLREKTTDRYDFEVVENDKLAFDHAKVILSGLERIRNKVNYTDIVFNMMPEYFTLGELQQVYEVILNKKLLDPAFRRIIADKVEKTNKMRTGGGHRPSYLFKYKKN